MSNKAISKYLDQYAEPEIDSFRLPENTQFERCLVIPAFAESPQFIERISKTWQKDSKLLVILVINRPEPCEPAAQEKANLFLGLAKQTLPLIISSNEKVSWRKVELTGPVFLLVDRCTESPIPVKQGVGLARKIGCDIALKLYTNGVLTTSWIHTTDADAHLPADYFDHKFSSGSAKVYPHRYLEAESALKLATKIYDSRNAFYQHELVKAGSAYGFNPTGSLLSLHLPSYAQVRGFPKRAGGEDFYLLNKMQKIDGVQSIEAAPIALECRTSDRVPFGTGPAVTKLLASTNPESEPIFYHPKCFDVFKRGLRVLHSTHPNQWLESPKMPVEFKAALEKLNIGPVQQHLSPMYTKSQELAEKNSKGHGYRHHLDLWFDAFLTLKTIHFLRDNYFGCISYTEWKEHRPD